MIFFARNIQWEEKKLLLKISGVLRFRGKKLNFFPYKTTTSMTFSANFELICRKKVLAAFSQQK